MTHPLPEPLASQPHVFGWLCGPLPEDVLRSLERLATADDVQHLAIMPDVHLAGEVCIGTVLATAQTIYPAAVGSDIGCGMAAIAFDTDAELLCDEQSAARLLAGLYASVPTNKHSSRAAVDVSALPDPQRLSDWSLAKHAQRDGRVQLGTLGRGNHFVEFQADTAGQLWLMIHSGSRGMGQRISRLHVQRSRQENPSSLQSLAADSPEGRAYLNDVQWAIAYATENRLAMMRAAEDLLWRLFRRRSVPETFIHSDHNHVRCEEHGGKTRWVHRKGALPATADQMGLIPGSMGTRSFHVAGRGCSRSLCSSSHGAGRQMSRQQAVRSVKLRQFEHEMHGIWYDHRRAAALRDEAPSAYKDIGQVMRAQRGLTRIVRELRPVLCYKGT